MTHDNEAVESKQEEVAPKPKAGADEPYVNSTQRESPDGIPGWWRCLSNLTTIERVDGIRVSLGLSNDNVDDPPGWYVTDSRAPDVPGRAAGKILDKFDCLPVRALLVKVDDKYPPPAWVNVNERPTNNKAEDIS